MIETQFNPSTPRNWSYQFHHWWRLGAHGPKGLSPCQKVYDFCLSLLPLAANRFLCFVRFDWQLKYRNCIWQFINAIFCKWVMSIEFLLLFIKTLKVLVDSFKVPIWASVFGLWLQCCWSSGCSLLRGSGCRKVLHSHWQGWKGSSQNEVAFSSKSVSFDDPLYSSWTNRSRSFMH